VAVELTKWVEDRAWTTGDGPGTISDAAVLWLRERRVLLPGATTLARLVARVRDEVLERHWDTLARRFPPLRPTPGELARVAELAAPALRRQRLAGPPAARP